LSSCRRSSGRRRLGAPKSRAPFPVRRQPAEHTQTHRVSPEPRHGRGPTACAPRSEGRPSTPPRYQ
jgi:hypothetical protein